MESDFPTKTNYEGGSTYSSNASREAREIENVLSKKRFAVHNNYYWTIILGIAGALDFFFYYLVELEFAIENDPNINDFNTKGRRSIERLSLHWKKEEDLTVQLPTNMLGTFLDLYAPLVDNLFCIIWVAEAFRRAYSCTGSAPAGTYYYQKTLENLIGIFVIFILFLPSSYWYPTGSSSAEYYGKLMLLSLKRFFARLGKRLTFFAIRHPKHFKQRTAVVLNLVRWLRYYVPIFASANKILSNLRKFLVTYGQHKAAKITRKVKNILSDRPGPKAIEERAALCLQKNYRRWKAVQCAKTMILFQKEGEAVAVLQKAFRGHSERARARIRAHTEELHDLHESRLLFNHQSELDKKREQELESDLTCVLRGKRNNIILIRPNCLFSTVWKAVVMGFVGIAIVVQSYEKMLTKRIDERNGMPYRTDSYLIQRFLPTPIGELEACHIVEITQTLAHRFLLTFLNLRNAAQSNNHITTIPWYCDGVLARMQSLYLYLGAFIINRAIISVGAILLFDVFISFFTGEFNSSGTLVPIPFIKRWILGFAVKLLLNPLSKPAAQAVLGCVMRAGPTRIYRWHLAIFKPVLHFLWWHVWIRLVQSSNSNSNAKTNLLRSKIDSKIF